MSMKRSGLLVWTFLISVLILAGTAANTWWLVNYQPRLELMVISFALQALGIIGLVWVGVVQAEQRLLRPLRRLGEHIKVLKHAQADHRLHLPEGHALKELAQQVEELGLELLRCRQDNTRALASATARIERRTARLEAILRDLAEGVVVCNLEHRLVLFNQSATQTLQRAGPVGLHRDLRSYFAGNQVASEMSKVLDIFKQHKRREVRGFQLVLNDEAQTSVDARISLVVEPDDQCSGYVLSFFAGEDSLKGARAVSSSILAERPEFYDFSLLERVSQYDGGGQLLQELTYVVFDTETTGLNPSSGDEIVQLSAVRVVNQQVMREDRFDQLVNPGFPIPPQSIRFHGISDDMVVGAPDICAAMKAFGDFCKDAVLVAHNAAFDLKFLNLKESKCGIAFNHPVLDTLLLSIVLQPDYPDHTLDAIAMRFGVHIPAEVRHTALGDAFATAEVFVHMLAALQDEGIRDLKQALEASSKVVEIRRLQEKF